MPYLSLPNIVSDIRALVGDSRVLVAIEGFGGSGKSTFAAALARALGSAVVVPIDDFIVKEHATEDSWERAFDLQRLERQVLEPASTGMPIVYQRLEWGTNSLSADITLGDSNVVIVEGISAYHPSIERYYHYTIWVDTPISIAAARGRARDAGNENEKHWDLWARNDLRYRQRYHPEARAHAVVSTN